jgi:hypothetical protein
MNKQKTKKTKQPRFPMRYLPNTLSKKDRIKQKRMLMRSRRMYKKHQYYERKPLQSYKHKTSNHIKNAQRIYKLTSIKPNAQLAKATGCSVAALKQIVKKGEGAYYSSGSRPNQTAQSWGLARLASSVTGGKAAAVDYNIITTGCDHSKRAFKLATKSRRQYKHGQGKTKKYIM